MLLGRMSWELHIGYTLLYKWGGSMKKIFVLLLLAAIFQGCVLNPSKPYEIQYSIDQIIRIDILEQNTEYSTWDERFLVRVTLDQTQYTEFLNQLYSLKGQPFFNPPSADFDLYVFCISYTNGEKEYISSNNNAYLVPGQDVSLGTYWFSDKDGFEQLIQKYLVK